MELVYFINNISNNPELNGIRGYAIFDMVNKHIVGAKQDELVREPRVLKGR